MAEFDDRGKVALWSNESDNANAPVAKGHFYAHRDIKEGEKINLDLWNVEKKNDKSPRMTGKVSDPQPQSKSYDAPNGFEPPPF